MNRRAAPPSTNPPKAAENSQGFTVKFDVIVIGGGPNGLMAAAYFAKRGKQVYVAEGGLWPTGLLRTESGGETFGVPLSWDGGAVLANVARELGISSTVPDVGPIAFSVAASDGSLLSVPTNSADTQAIARHSKKDAERWPQFIKQFGKFSEILGRAYQQPPADIDTSSIRDLLPLAAIGLKVRGLGRADMTEFLRVPPMSIQDYVDDSFESELLRTAIASHAIRDMRQGPRSGGTTFNLLHYMVGVGRVGARAFPDKFYQAVHSALRQSGVTVNAGPDARVVRVVVRDGAVTGVALASGKEIGATTVVSTADPKHTLLNLIEPQWLDPEIGLAAQNIKLRGCTAYVCYTTDAAPPDAFRAPVCLTSTTLALEKAADAAKYGEISADAHVEVWSPSLMTNYPTAGMAPAGQYVVLARMQFAPYALKTGAWTSKDASVLEQKVTAAIRRVLPKFSDTVTQVRVLTPADIEKEFGVTEGAMSHGEMTLDQIMFMRPIPGWGRYQMPIRGLFLGGAGAHPGPGILGGAGLLAAKAALK
jgi:phytoene dehydrogenase-like protein